jgi:hypothetical protein
MTKSNENEIAKLEHDNVYHIKKTSVYSSDGSGNLVRAKVSTEDKQDDIIAKMPTLEANGGVPVNLQDQTTRPIALRMNNN